jgi:hypothetical protein
MSGLPSAGNTAVLDAPPEGVAPPVDPANPVIAQVVETPQPQAPQNGPQDPAADAIERARQQEKEKLYGRLQERDVRLAAMEAELKALRDEREAKAAAETKAQEAAAEAERLKKIAETSAKDLVLQQQAEWEQKFAELQAEREREREELAKEAEFNALRAYIQEQARTHSDDIAPQLLDLVDGNTREEVDASIEKMKAKTAEILESVKAAQTQQRSLLRGVSPTSIPGAAPEGDGGLRNLTAQDIKNMSMSDWGKVRKQLISGADNSKNRGLFD